MSELKINKGEMNRLLHSRGGPVYRRVERTALAVRDRARTLAPTDGGALKASITLSAIRSRPSAGTVTTSVGSRLPYAIYQERGTGIYGPAGRPIRPRRSRYLVFRPKGSARTVFARQVRGAPATHYLTRALRLEAKPPWRVTITAR